MNALLRRFFEPILGLPCWNVERGWGSFLTFEFGRPHLVVREPSSDLSTISSKKVRELYQRRTVHVRGQWHLWIYCCNWTVYDRTRIVGDSSSPRRIDRAAKLLNGQKLLSVALAPRGARTEFIFDLGGVLQTAPYDRRSEQWYLYEPSGSVLTLRADRRYSYQRATSTHAERWRRAP